MSSFEVSASSSIRDPVARRMITISFSVVIWHQGQVHFSGTERANVPSVSLVIREWGCTILVGTLLDTIRASSAYKVWLRLALSYPGGFRVSTTRMPDFMGEDFRLPESGYRRLGSYRELLAQAERGMPSLEAYEEKNEVASVDPYTPVAAKYRRMWAPIQLKPEYHFIIIFEPRFKRHRYLANPAPCTESEATGQVQENRDLLLPKNSLFGPRTSFPPSAEISPLLQGSSMPSSTPTHHHPTGSNELTIQLQPNLTIPEVFEAFGLSQTQIQEAQFVPARWSTPFFSILTNFYALLHVLQTLHIPEPRSYGGLNLTNEAVLIHLGWTQSTYGRKLVLFRWVEKAALATWNPRFSVQGEREARLYKIWRGIVWYFKPGGGLERRVAPRFVFGSFEHFDEQAAAQLKQSMLYEQRYELAQFLILPGCAEPT